MRKILTILFSASIVIACASNSNEAEENKSTNSQNISSNPSVTDTAYFAGGCFWCVEASFDQIEGVVEAVSGYSGGSIKEPTYKQVSYGQTNHAESVMVIFDPTIITYDVLLDIFFTAHDPTQLNRQGPDVGKQYRSAIFYTDATQKQIAESKIKDIGSNYTDPIVTEVTKFKFFHPAEDYHQDFEKKNPNNTYIVNVSKPKIEKVAKKFEDRLKK